MTTWGEFCPTLEDVVILTGLPLLKGGEHDRGVGRLQSHSG